MDGACIASAGRSLLDVLRVQQLHDYYLDLLAYEIERNHMSTHSRILIKIFQLLPLLGPINAEQATAIMSLRVNAPPGMINLFYYCWQVGLSSSAVERQSLTSVLSPSCARPVTDG